MKTQKKVVKIVSPITPVRPAQKPRPAAKPSKSPKPEIGETILATVRGPSGNVIVVPAIVTELVGDQITASAITQSGLIPGHFTYNSNKDAQDVGTWRFRK